MQQSVTHNITLYVCNILLLPYQVYVHEVSFDVESEGVAYTYLPFPPRSSPCTPSLPLSISLSILSLDKDGVILTAIDQVVENNMQHIF